jgi:hypothetical protein
MANQVTESTNGWQNSLSSVTGFFGAVLPSVASMYSTKKQADVAKMTVENNNNPYIQGNNRIFLMGALGLGALAIIKKAGG